MSKGFLVLAQNTELVNYVQQAYALALSIKHSQTEVTSISLITNDEVPDEYKLAFDQIIPIPWFENNADSRYSAEHRWKLYYASPYEETIVLDTDMLLLEDISSWWKYCENYDLKFCTRIKNYKLEVVNDTVHRKAFIANHLPNVYFALHYFKKNRAAYEFYKVLEFVVNNWQWCWDTFAMKNYQEWLSMDLASAIAIDIMGLNNEIADSCSPLEFIHMKPPIQGWPIVPHSWQDAVPFVLNSRGELVVGNIKQGKVFHYIEKNFLSTKIMAKLEGLSNGT